VATVSRSSGPAKALNAAGARNLARPEAGTGSAWFCRRCCLTLKSRHASSAGPIIEEQVLTRSEIWRLEKYLRNLFRLDTITIVERPKQPDSVEMHINGEFVGVLFKDEEDGEISYAFNMAILEMDLPEPPTSRV
jgi:hypothetical protein